MYRYMVFKVSSLGNTSKCIGWRIKDVFIHTFLVLNASVYFCILFELTLFRFLPRLTHFISSRLLSVPFSFCSVLYLRFHYFFVSSFAFPLLPFLLAATVNSTKHVLIPKFSVLFSQTSAFHY